MKATKKLSSLKVLLLALAMVVVGICCNSQEVKAENQYGTDYVITVPYSVAMLADAESYLPSGWTWAGTKLIVEWEEGKDPVCVEITLEVGNIGEYTAIYNGDYDNTMQVTVIRSSCTITEEFISNLYTYVLGRTYDTDGLSFWDGQLTSGSLSARKIVKEFFASSEFTSRELTDSEYVELLYNGIFGRKSDATGKAYWTNVLASGYSRSFVLSRFLDSPEFTSTVAALDLD